MSVGSDLRQARETAGLSLADVAATTRIRASLIGRIEAEDWAACGGAVYARGHIRSLASAAHVDPAPLVAAFDADHGSPGPVALSEGLDESTGDPEIRERRGPNWLAAAVGAAGVVTALLLVSLLARGGDSSRQAGAPPSPGATSLAPAPEPPASRAPAPPASSPPAITAQRPPVVVQVKVTGAASWIYATSPGKDFGVGSTYVKGKTATFQSDKPITVRVGDAGAVQLIVNGRNLGSPGTPGQVLSTKFDADSGQA